MASDSIVRGLYRFQQRVGLTAPEFRAAVAFAGLLLAGSAVEHWRARAVPIDPVIYEESDAYFRERAVMAGLGPVAVPDSSETPDPDSSATPLPVTDADEGLPAPKPGPLDMNSAGAPELERLPGIGPALARRIVAFRDRNGPFLYVEDLLMVRGIGAKTLERLAPLVTVDGVAAPDSVTRPIGP